MIGMVGIDPIGCSTVRYCHRNPTKGLERERQVGKKKQTAFLTRGVIQLVVGPVLGP